MSFSDVKNVAIRYDCSIPTVWNWARLGIIPKPHKIGPNTTRWSNQELDEHDRSFIEGNDEKSSAHISFKELDGLSMAASRIEKKS